LPTLLYQLLLALKTDKIVRESNEINAEKVTKFRYRSFLDKRKEVSQVCTKKAERWSRRRKGS
jgi:hypothetical protein